MTTVRDVSIVPATREHLTVLVKNIRPADAAECAQAWLSVREAVQESFDCSFWTKAAVQDDGYVFAIWGVGGAVIAETPTAWLLTAKGIERRANQFVRTVRDELVAMANDFGAIEAFIDADYAKALRLFKALGCCLEPVDGGMVRMVFGD